MRRLWFWAFVLLAAIAGFLLGRATGIAPIPGLSEIHKEFPLFPAPPKPDAPAPVVAANAPPTQESDIIVEEPVDGAVVSTSFIDVAGRAKTVGGPLHATVKDAAGTVIAESDLDLTATAAYGRFGQTLAFKDKQPEGPGTVEVARTNGGAAIVRHVTFSAGGPPQAALTVKAYFRKGNASFCDSVEAVTRPFDGKVAVYRAAIEATLKGPTDAEKAQGFTSAIPSGVTLKSVAADADGLVTADFTLQLTRGLKDSCRIASVRAQIEATLKQFPEVHDVVISVQGKTDGVLQP